MTSELATQHQPKQLTPAIAYKQGKSALVLTESKRLSLCVDVLTKMFFRHQQSKDNNTLSVMAKYMAEDWDKKFPTMTDKEVELACDASREKEEFFINNNSIYQLLKSYAVCEARRAAIREANSRVDKPVDKAQVAKEYWQTIVLQCECVKAEKPVTIAFPLQQFKDMWAVGIIRITDVQKREYENQAKANILGLDVPIQRNKRGQVMSLHEAIRNGNLNEDQRVSVVIDAARLAIVDFFKTCDLAELKAKVEKHIKTVKV